MSDTQSDIWRLQAQFDTKGLIEALRNEDVRIRRRAAVALRALGVTDALADIKTVLQDEQDPETRETLVAALEGLEAEKNRNEEEARTDPVRFNLIEQLLSQLQSGDTKAVIEATNRLGELRNKRAVEPLVMIFNNVNTPIDLRLAVAEALLKLESAPVEVALLGALRSSRWRIRRNGAAILGQLKAQWAVEPLAKALRDENEVVRKTARAALRYINTPQARAALAQFETKPQLSDVTAATGEAAQVIPPVTPTVAPAVPPTLPPTEPARPAPVIAADVAPNEAPTQRSRPTQKLEWPKRERSVHEDPTLTPTKPLNPKRLEEAEERLKNSQPTKSETLSAGDQSG